MCVEMSYWCYERIISQFMANTALLEMASKLRAEIVNRGEFQGLVLWGRLWYEPDGMLYQSCRS